MDLYQEIELKANLLQEGLRVEPSTLEGVGTKYTEKETWQFAWEFLGLEPGQKLPNDLRLPLGTWVQARINNTSPYLAKREDGELIIEKEGRFVTTMTWGERPGFYDKKTSAGVEMWKLGQVRGEDGLCFCYSDYCYNWKDGLQCRFCNINYHHKSKPDNIVTPEKADQMGEVAAAAVEEWGDDIHFGITGGALPQGKDVEANIRVMEAIRQHTGLERIPGWAAHPEAPLNLKAVDRLYEAGGVKVVFNLEVWEPSMFKYICPGKAKHKGRDNWIRALEYAVSVFGRGRSISFFVCGLEEKEIVYEGCEYLAEKGILPMVAPWLPMVGSKLEGHRSPTPEWMLEVHEKVVDIIAKWLPEVLTEESFQAGSTCGCYRCLTPVLINDMIRNRLGGIERVMKKDKAKRNIKA